MTDLDSLNTSIVLEGFSSSLTSNYFFLPLLLLSETDFMIIFYEMIEASFI